MHSRLAPFSFSIAWRADDVSTATALYNLAGLTKRLNKWKEAEEAYAAALKIFKAKLGTAAGETADTLYQVCHMYSTVY